MFNTPWYDRALIKSDEGFALRWGGDSATYVERGRKLTLTVDIGAGGANVFVETVSRWDDDPATIINRETQCQIVDNVKRALEWKGFDVKVFP
jgi:hypothetical protein